MPPHLDIHDHHDKGPWATNDHDCSPGHYTKKNPPTPHMQPEPELPGEQSIKWCIVNGDSTISGVA